MRRQRRRPPSRECRSTPKIGGGGSGRVVVSDGGHSGRGGGGRGFTFWAGVRLGKELAGECEFAEAAEMDDTVVNHWPSILRSNE